MKKTLSIALVLTLLLSGLATISASAEQTVNLYYSDGRMATVPVWMADSCRRDGWTDNFPYYGKEIWINTGYFMYNTTDIYGTRTSRVTVPNEHYIKAKILWYDENEFTQISQYQKRLNTLVILYNGGQFKIPFKDFLSCFIGDYLAAPQIFWENPKTRYGIADESWAKIQNYQIWVGMPVLEFLLVKVYMPDKINEYNYGYGDTEQWVYQYSYGTEYYYFKNDCLTSWQK